MKKYFKFSLVLLVISVLFISCVTRKKKNETSKFGKFYHNTTAFYNGYWNAKEIMKESMKTLRLANVDDYNKLLEVEDFVSVDNPKMVKADMDKIIEKVTTVSQLHEPSAWVDDCYVMMAKAQYLKHEYETAEETLQYFQEDFNPSNPYGRNYKSKKPTGKAAKKIKEEEKKDKAEIKEKEKEAKKEIKEEKAKTKAEERKEKERQRENEKKEREKEKKERDKQKKENAKNKKKAGSVKSKNENSPVKDTIISIGNETKQNTAKVNTSGNVKSPEITKDKDSTKTYKTPEPVKPQEDNTAYSEGILWLAKTYIKRENWYASEILLKKLETSAVNDNIKGDLPATFANLYIKQKKYAEAIPKLIQAINDEDDKQLKARYSYIAGQISQLENDNTAALKYFSDAKDYAKDFKMEFMSELAIAKNGIMTGKIAKSEVTDNLKKMLKEDKNVQLKDQIYFTLAEIEVSQNNTNDAIDYFKKSIANNNADQKLKAEAYYNIANMFYNKEKYLEASVYFDTTITLFVSSDPRYAQIQKYVSNLKDIASNIEIIRYQDTLLYFVTLNEDEQLKVIPKWLEKNKKPESPVGKNSGLISKQLTISGNVDFGTSNFFAYNKTGKMKGKEEFIKIWGTRPLADDWRRSSKAYGNNTESTEKKVAEADGQTENVNKEEYDKFIKTLPDNPIKKQESNDKIMSAMFTLGKLFRDKIENFSKSAETLEGMHTRYGPTPYELDSYFYLYLDYTDLNNSTKAEEYKNKIVRKYPDSKYTAILTDPDYFSKTRNKPNKPEAYYKAVYALYEKGEYLKALDALDNVSRLSEENNPYLAKMALLRAMCLGARDGKDEYVKALNNVIIAFPNTPEQSKAKEIMRFLGGDKTAFNNMSVEEVDKIYQKEDDQVHYVAIITYDLDETQHVNFKVAISEYNKQNYKTERLQMGDASLNTTDNSQIILVRKFDNGAKAMAYYNKVIADKESYTGGVKASYDVLPVSQRNYRKMLSERSAAGYRIFFEANYAGAK
ncbi:MAG: hypothetical protein H7X99_02870 [Saprospiraceae bacterium]|nr:hypothetical protein [Saprospiraceae bacterium]